MKPSETLNSCPLPISTTQTARGLLRIYARLKGELVKQRSGEDLMMKADEATRVMEHIAALMPFLGVNFDPAALRPVRSRLMIGPLDFGELRANILQQLKSSDDWMSYPELADSILAKHSVELTAGQRKHFLQKLREATHALKRAGAVEREKELAVGDGAELQRWRLSTTLFRRRST